MVSCHVQFPWNLLIRGSFQYQDVSPRRLARQAIFAALLTTFRVLCAEKVLAAGGRKDAVSLAADDSALENGLSAASRPDLPSPDDDGVRQTLERQQRAVPPFSSVWVWGNDFAAD